jgi:hypothetical protein
MGHAISKHRKKKRGYYSPPPSVMSLQYTPSEDGGVPNFKFLINPFNDTLEPSKNVNNDLNHTISYSNVNNTLVSSLQFDEEDLTICGNDFFSKTTMDIISLIFAYLSIDDICTIQRVSRFWCKTWEANDMWRMVVKREAKNWTCKASDYVMKCARAEADGEKQVRWKELLRDYYRKRLCCKCNGKYRICYNTPMACVRHSNIRDLVEDRGIPSGVYWLCCLEKQKSAPGCTVGGHEERREVKALR